MKLCRVDKASNFLLIIVLGAWGVFFYWMLRPYNILELYQLPLPILNENHEVELGGVLDIEVDYSKNYDLNEITTRNIECADGNLVTLTVGHSHIPVGADKNVMNTTVPRKTSLGECVLKLTVRYEPNPLRVITYHVETEPFIVVMPE